MRRAVSGNAHAPAAVIARLAAEDDAQIARNAAAAPQANAPTLRHLWNADDVWVRAEVAAHPNCPPDILAEAEAATDPLIRRKRAANPAIAEAALLRLLVDPDDTSACGGGPQSGRLGRMSRRGRRPFSQGPSSVCQAQSAFVVSDGAAGDRSGCLGAALDRPQSRPAARPARPAGGRSQTEVRRSVARNLACPPHLLVVLATDPQPWVRAGVALREDAPDSAIARLTG